MARITRRQLLKYGAAGGAVLFLPLRVGTRQALAQVPGGTLPPGGIPKYVTPLVIPPAMPRTAAPPAVRGVDYYEIAVRQFRQHILPQSMGLEPTTVWSYGSADHPGSFNYPAFTIEAGWRRPVRVKWINQLVDANGDYLPHLLPVDQTLHWANPPGGPAGTDTHGTDPDPVHGPCADRHAPARRALVRGERRLRRGLVSAGGQEHPAGIRALRLPLPAIQGRGSRAARSGVDAGQRGLRVRQRPAGGDDVVPRPHARDDPRERLRRTGRLLPAARRTRGRGRRQAPRACPGARRPAGNALLRDPDRDPGPLRSTPTARSSTRTTGPSSRGSTPRSCRSRSSPTRPATARATSRRSSTRSSSATRWS